MEAGDDRVLTAPHRIPAQQDLGGNENEQEVNDLPERMIHLEPAQATHFGVPIRMVAAVLAAAVVVVLARAAWVQSFRSDQVLTKGALVLQADGVRRYQYNPRMLQIARDLPKGDIFDRNGVPLATSDWSSLERHRAEYDKLGIHLDQAVSKNERRHYPLGAPFFYLVGDVRSDFKPGASGSHSGCAKYEWRAPAARTR